MPASLELKAKGYTDSEISQIADLHRNSITSGFLSSMKSNLLELLYSYIAKDTSCVLLSCCSDGKVVGFVCGATNVRKMYLGFARRHFFRVGVLLLPQIVSFASLKKVLELLSYPFVKRDYTQIESELLSMAVAEPFRGKGISDWLFKSFVSEYERRGLLSFKIVAGSNLTGAQRFYSKMGAKDIAVMEVHGGVSSKLFAYEIRQKSVSSLDKE